MKNTITSKAANYTLKNANKDETTMRTSQTTGRKLRPGLLAFCLLLGAFLFASMPAAYAAGPDSNPLTHWDTRYNYFLRFPAAAQHGIRHRFNPQGGHDVVQDQRSMGPGMVVHSKSGQVFAWPVTIPTAMSSVPTFRDEAIQENLFQTFGYPVSDTQFQVIERYNHNRFLEQLYDPEKVMWMSTSMAGVMANSAGNSTANMGVNQCVNAIDYVRQPLGNFTAEAGNVWQRIRYELFIPMAVLLLLPGAVLAQVRAIVAQGSGVLGDVSPFEGLLRSVIAIFLIPGSFLVINYGIDVSNSLTFTIADEYHRMFGSDMYEDAKCAIIRALPINDPNSNRNAIEPPIQAPIVEHDVWSPYESWDLAVRLNDPCIPFDESRLPDEDVNASMMINRLLFNGTLASLGLTWNIYCAFQMVFLYYLWCMGPVASALWVWPIPRLRQAFGSWVEGVIILCFWALFWNTSIFLLAAFKGIGDTGTVYTAALVFLCVQSVKSAFDFVSLVSSAASGAETMAKEAMGQLSSAMSKGGGSNKGGGGGGGGGAAPSGGGGGGNRGGAPAAPSTATNSTSAPVGSISPSGGGGGGGGGGSRVSTGGLANNLSVSPGGGGIGGGTGGAPGGPGGAPGGPGGAPGGPEGAGPGGAKVDTGPPPAMGGEGGPGGGKGGGKGEGDAAGAATAALGGLALGGSKGGDGGGAPPMSNASYSMSKSVTNTGGDLNAGDLSQLANRNLGDNLSNLTDNALTNQMGMPPMAGAMAGDLVSSAAMTQAGNALFGNDGPLGNMPGGVDTKALTGLMAGGPDGLLGGDMPAGMSSAADRNPLAKDLALDQMLTSGSQRDIMANGIDADVAGHPQAELARSATQDLMKATGVGDDMLNRALAGDPNATSAIQDKLGVSPMTLELARGGDPGAAALTMEAAGRNAVEHARNGDNSPMEALSTARDSGNLAAAEALGIAAIPLSGEALQQRESLVHQAAIENSPMAARELLSQNGEHTIASMSASQAVTQELQQAGVTKEQFSQALGGDTNMQNMVSERMGGVGFDKVQGAYYGDTGDAATTMVARGNSEIQSMQSQGMSSEQIQNYAKQNGDVSMIAAQAAQSGTQQGTFERAMGGDQTAQRELQQAIGSNPTMLEAVHSGSQQARLAVEGATGQNATVMSAASHNAQSVLSQMTGDPRGVEQALNGSPQQREAFVQQMSSELGVAPRVLNQALGGGSLESGTIMARAGQIAEVGTRGDSGVQLSAGQHRLAEGLQSGNGLMMAAQATYSAVSHGGQDTQTLSHAAAGSHSHALAAAGAVQTSQELRSMGSSESSSILQASSGVTHSAREAMASFSVANPTASLHDASVTAQTTLRESGIDPQAVVSGVRSGDTSELSRAATTLGVSPDVVQGALMRGDSGDALTLVGAHGRQMIAQGPEAIQHAAQSQSGQLALHVAQTTPQNVLTSAMSGNDMAQAQIARSVACDPQVLGSAAGNEFSLRAVGATLGDGAYPAVAASSAAQDMIRMHPDSNLVQNALYGQGSQQQAAMTHLARDMNVSPQVLSNSLSGSTQDVSAMVSASAVGMHRAQETGQASSPYFAELSRGAGEHAQMAHAIHAAGHGQNFQAVSLAAQSVPGAQEAVRATMHANPHLSSMMREGNHAANAIMTVASHVGHHHGHSNYAEAIRDVGIVAAAGTAIAHNLRHSDPVHGIQPHHHRMDRGAISGYEQFTHHGGGHQPHSEHRGPDHRGPVNDPNANRNAIEPPTHRPNYETNSSYERFTSSGGGMEGTDGMSRPQPPDSLGHARPAGVDGQHIAQGPHHDAPTGGWFDQGKRDDAPSGPKISDATQGAAPAIVPGGSPQNRSLAPQQWQGTQRDRKAHDEKTVKQRIAQLEEQAKRAKEANNQAEYDAIKRNLEQYGRRLDEE